MRIFILVWIELQVLIIIITSNFSVVITLRLKLQLSVDLSQFLSITYFLFILTAATLLGHWSRFFHIYSSNVIFGIIISLQGDLTTRSLVQTSFLKFTLENSLFGILNFINLEVRFILISNDAQNIVYYQYTSLLKVCNHLYV